MQVSAFAKKIAAWNETLPCKGMSGFVCENADRDNIKKANSGYFRDPFRIC